MSAHMDRHKTLVATKKELAAKLLAIDPSKHHLPSQDGGFSPAELMEHLAKAEDFNLVFLRKNSPKQISGRKVKTGPFYKMILNSFQNLKRTSAPPMLKPTKQPDIKAQHEVWLKHLDEIDTFLAQVADGDQPFIKMNFLFGTLSANQFLDFQEAHIKYHDHYFPKV